MASKRKLSALPSWHSWSGLYSYWGYSRMAVKKVERKALEELKKEYGLPESDFWPLPQNKKVKILSHDGCKKIASQENIEFFDINWINMGERVGKFEFVYSLELHAKKAESDFSVHATGEANSENCKMAYPVAMAEKRAKDRAILLLVGFSELGVHSEIEGKIAEADNEFDKPSEEASEKATVKPSEEASEDRPTMMMVWPLAQSKGFKSFAELRALMTETLKTEVKDSASLTPAQLKKVYDALKAKEDVEVAL